MNIKLFMGINYFFSTWIANFGVVPLLLFLAFLLLPIFTFLLDLTNFVTLVLDTITQLRKLWPISLINYLRLNVLPSTRRAVKIILYVLLACVASRSYSSTQVIDKTTVLLAIGELKELTITKLTKFTVTNSTIISHKLKSKSGIIIKGQKLGYTEIVIWSQGSKTVYQVYVLAKQRQLKILHFAEILKGIGLSIELAGPLIIATGEISDLKNYLFLKNLEKDNKKVLIIKARIAKKLRNEIFLNIYKRFFDSYEENISCYSNLLNITCEVPSHINPTFYSDLKLKFKAHFISVNTSRNKKNYLVSIKFFRILKSDTSNFDKGLSSLSSQISKLINQNWYSLVENNSFILSGSNLFIQTLSNHSVLATLSKKISFETGVEIPYKNNSTDNRISTTKWKFSGIKLDFKVEPKGRSFIVHYNTSFNKASHSNNFSITKSSSSIHININESESIFKSEMLNLGRNLNKIPYISKVPILGEFFKSKNQHNISERILAYVKLSYQN